MSVREAAGGRGSANGTLFALVVMFLGYNFLESGLSPALPSIQQALGVSAPTIAWIFTGLMLSGAVLTPLLGRLGDIRDKRNVVLAAMIMIAVGTALPALAQNIVLLTAGQLMQGAGFGLLAVSVGLLTDIQTPERAKASNGYLIAAGGVGVIAGPLLAGVILTALPYQWLYLIALPLMVIAIVAAWRFIPSAPPLDRGNVDWRGAAILAAGLVLLLVGITMAATRGWSSPTVFGLLVGGLLVLALFAAVAVRTASPIIDVRLLKKRPVLLACTASWTFGFGTIALFVIIPMLVSLPTDTGYALGGSPTLIGLYLLPLGITSVASAPFAGRLERLIGVRWVMVLAHAALLGAGLVLLAVPSAPAMIAVAAGLSGLAIGLGWTQALNVVVTVVPPERVASVNALSLVARNIGGALGSQIAAALIATEVIAGTGLPAWEGFELAFVVLGAVGFVGLLMSLAFPARLARV